jgi:hypothetical protein
LKLDLLLLEELFEGIGAFVVESGQFGLKAGCFEAGEDYFVGFQNCGCLSVWNGFDMDGVAVVVIQEEDVVVASAGGDDELSCLVAIDLAGSVNCCCKAPVAGAVGCIRLREVIRVKDRFEDEVGRIGWIDRGDCWWCRLLVLAGLVEMAFGGGE